MLSKIFLIYLLVLASFAHAEQLKFLGAQEYKDQNNQPFRIPPGQSVKILDRTEDTVHVQYGEKILSVPEKEFSTYFDTPTSQEIAGVMASACEKAKPVNNSIANCTNKKEDKCKLSSRLNETSRDILSEVIRECEPNTNPEIIHRANILPLSEYQKSCTDKALRPEPPSKNTWSAPVPVPDCTPSEALILRTNEVKKHKAYIASCPDKEPSLANIGLVSPEPQCMLPSDSSQITKIVLHASEGSPVAGPGALYCDYAAGGYNDLPYHFYIAKDRTTNKWVIYEGRSLKYQGAHVRANLNADSIGIAIAGDYEPGGPSPSHPFRKSEAPPAEAVQLAQSLIAKLKKEYKSIKKIQGHGEALYQGDHCHKNCPGPGCQFVINRLNEKLFKE